MKVLNKQAFDLVQFKNKIPIVGMDEVGRGALAGPVAVGACILDLNNSFPFYNLIKDSKELTKKKRQDLVGEIKEHAVWWNIAFRDNKYIEDYGINDSVRVCMLEMAEIAKRQYQETVIHPTSRVEIIEGEINVMSDHVTPPLFSENGLYRNIEKGDKLSLTIGAASIIAKVFRDEMMDQYGKEYPEYNFQQHKGYGTAGHQERIAWHGICSIHRKTFKGVREYA